MASMLTRFRHDVEDDLQDQIARLGKEVMALRKIVARRGAAAYADTRDSAGDLYEELWERVSDAMPDIRRRARIARDTARDNPVAAVVTVGIIGVLLALLVRR